MHPIGAIVYLGLCVLIGYLGRDKKFGFIGNFLISLFLSPVIGLIVWLVQADAEKKVPAPEKAA
jgi:phosphate/sulfate permease